MKGIKLTAIISDIHSNREALTATLEDIAKSGASEVLCLGDIVGYGPDPEECIDLVEEHCRFSLSGNHDYATLTFPEHFNPLAAEAIKYTKTVLEPGKFRTPWGSRKKARWQFLQDLPVRKRETETLYVHGSPRDERNEYILESDILYGNYDKIDEIFSMIPRLCFIGHSHVPGIITQDYRFLKPVDYNYQISLEPGQKYIINVGSVGQPRDGDNRASYVIVQEDLIVFHRIAYDFHATMSKMERIGEISKEAAVRLQLGR